jgi:alpha-1,6-mannosyltransferase
VQAAGVLVAGGATVVLLARSHRTGLVGLGTALVLVALLGPVVQPWYLAWGGAVLAAAASPQRNRLVVAGSTALCFAVLPAGPDVGRQALAQPLAVVVALAVLTVLALAARRPTG